MEPRTIPQKDSTIRTWMARFESTRFQPEDDHPQEACDRALDRLSEIESSPNAKYYYTIQVFDNDIFAGCLYLSDTEETVFHNGNDSCSSSIFCPEDSIIATEALFTDEINGSNSVDLSILLGDTCDHI
jgi:hypothetical protein